ncbi:MAG: NAD(P)H-hydrate dehydratase [Candidatus Saccharicenans sp.]|jgi:NAD(P)H-hydrate epimerase|nr:NAD(P)H-hydrate dehydratase [Candidatus Saccharicenans sp.]MDH7492972.1 NAD(P)H-hydrate dehydratase [Candidatus Saccharicenans sp.]
MKILTAAQMREIDRIAIEEIGLPGPVLMENAGLQVTAVLRNELGVEPGMRVVVVAGKGNNGGDGLVVARHLHNQGVDCPVLLIGSLDEVRGDAALNLKIALKTGVRVIEIRDETAWKRFRKILSETPIIVDALFGTGLSSPLQGLYERVVNDINNSGAFVVSVDIPSGLSSDTFQLIGSCVRADLTVTLGAPKVAHFFPPAEEYVGELVVADISLPPLLLEQPGLNLELVELESLIPFFQPRKRDTHKGTYGHLLIIAGSRGKTGAAAMAGRAALKMGAGLVTVATASSCLPLVARSSPELMTEPLAETDSGTIAAEALGRALELIQGKDALLIGPGLSTNPATMTFVLKLLEKIKNFKKPVILDADGLNIISSRPDRLSSLPEKTILTPHPGEFSRLTGLSTAEILKRRLEIVAEFARRHKVHLVLKGYRTLVASPVGRVMVNPTGNPGMASGGTGDVLSGLLASEAMQVADILQAAVNAVFVHGLSGDLAAEKVGEKSLTATDLIRFLPRAIRFIGSGGEDESENY